MRNVTPRQVQYAGIISLIGLALVLLTHLVRPWLGTLHSSWMVFAFGVLPNFGAALSQSFLMIVLATRFLHLEHGGSKFPYFFVVFLGVTFVGLTAW